jgi:hypothetical protein
MEHSGVDYSPDIGPAWLYYVYNYEPMLIGWICADTTGIEPV